MKLIMAFILLSTLAACGGGNSKPESGSTNNQQTKINSDVKKLSYNVNKVNNDGYIDVNFAENDVSILLNIALADKSKGLLISEIKDPDNTTIYKGGINQQTGEPDKVISDFFDSPLGSTGDTAVFLPPTPRLTMKKGTYRFKIIREDNEPLNKVEVFVKSVKANERIDRLSYKINMNVWVAHPNIATDGQDDIINYGEFKQLFNTTYRQHIDTILAPHSLKLGKINFHLANEATAEKYADLNEESLGEACREMKKVVTDEFALNIGFVKSLGDGAGISPSPGNIMDKTASNGCAFVAQSAYIPNPEVGFTEDLANQMMAGNILHESAHFLSLEHPTEETGDNFDQLNDTPECSITTNDGRDNTEDFGGTIPGTRDGKIDDFECGINGGADNFLFYNGVPQYLPFIMSADQASIFKRHPLTIRQ